MPPKEFQLFIASVRGQADAALAKLAMIDLAELSAELCAEYEAVRQGWEALRRMTELDVLALHRAACLQAGRELTPEELRGLVSRQ